MQQSKRGFGAYGWILLVFGLSLFWFAGGYFTDGTNVIAPAVAAKLGVDKGVILNMNAVAGVVGVLICAAAGQVNQRIGPRKVAAVCLILSAVGHIAAGNAANMAMYLVAMCLVSGGGAAASFVGFGALAAMWFPRRQGQAMSIAAMGANLGTMLYVPLLTVLVAAFGIGTTVVFSGGAGIIIGILGLILLRDTPTERGLFPDNVTQAEFKANYSATPPEIDGQGGWTTAKLLRTKEVWLCSISTGLLMLCQIGIMSQLVDRNIETGMSPALAVGVLSAIAVVGLIGSFFFGKLVVGLGVKKAMIGAGGVYMAALLLNVSGVTPLIYLSLVLIGLVGAAAPNLVNTLPTSVFGRVGYAKVNSVVFPITSIIYMLNFAVNGVITMLFHNLRVSYIIFAIFALIAILLVLGIQDHKYDQDYMAAQR